MPLKATSVKHSRIASLEGFLSGHLFANHDIWVEYHAQEIHAEDKFKGDYIHDGLIESLDQVNGIVTILDPLPYHRQRLSVTLDALEGGISTRYGRECGFVVIEKVSA